MAADRPRADLAAHRRLATLGAARSGRRSRRHRIKASGPIGVAVTVKAIAIVLGLAFLVAASAVSAPAKAQKKGSTDDAPEGRKSSALRISVRPDGPVSPGQTVEVTVDGPRKGPVNALLVFPLGGMDVKELPFTARITIPEEAVGSFGIIVTMAGESDTSLFGPGSVSSEKTLSVKISAALQQLEVLPTELRFMKPGDYGELYVYGHYADGVRRRVESSSAGTTYTSSDPRIVSVVAENGRVRAEGFGTALVTVENSGITVRIPVEVRPEAPNRQK